MLWKIYIFVMLAFILNFYKSDFKETRYLRKSFCLYFIALIPNFEYDIQREYIFYLSDTYTQILYNVLKLIRISNSILVR